MLRHSLTGQKQSLQSQSSLVVCRWKVLRKEIMICLRIAIDVRSSSSSTVHIPAIALPQQHFIAFIGSLFYWPSALLFQSFVRSLARCQRQSRADSICIHYTAKEKTTAKRHIDQCLALPGRWLPCLARTCWSTRRKSRRPTTLDRGNGIVVNTVDNQNHYKIIDHCTGAPPSCMIQPPQLQSVQGKVCSTESCLCLDPRVASLLPGDR